MGLKRLAVVLCLAGTVGGCSNALRWSADADTHIVRPGETLYAIAFDHGLDYRDLAAWNGLGDGSLIHPGKRLRLTAPSGAQRAPGKTPGNRAPATAARPAAKPAAPVVAVSRWQWPASGAVLAAYGATPKTGSGIHIGGQRGQSVRAAAGGQVVYSGDSLPGYGQLLIIKHNADFLSAYGFNDVLLVTEGDQVATGQKIARMGQGPGRRPLLHFEIRRNGKPVDPVAYLPKR
jgi:lipoprotein NlpD